MRCLVTGASGHLGSYLTRMLLCRGHEVAILVRPESDLWRLHGVLKQVEVIRGDLREVDRAAPALTACAPEIVFHLAWYGVSSEYRNDIKQIYHNLFGSLRLLELAAAAGCRCCLGLGSQAEYGPYNGVLQEDLPLKPVTVYGVTKLSLGLLARELCASIGVRYLWLRLLATYGPKDDVRHLIPTVILKLLAGEKPSLTKGEQKWDYLYVEDACEAICAAAFNPAVQGVYNLGSGQAYPVQEIVERIRDLIDPQQALGFGEIPYGPGQIMHLQADIAKLHRDTGWQPRTALGEGLRRTVRWYREQAPETVKEAAG